MISLNTFKPSNDGTNAAKKTKGFCGLIIAMGVTGASRGNPQPKDMLAVLETKSIQGEELGMGILQLVPEFDFE